MKIKFKIMILAIGSILLTSIIIAIIIDIVKKDVNKEVLTNLEKVAVNETAIIARDIYHMLDTQNQVLLKKVKSDLKVAQEILDQNGKLKFSEETINWNAINQYTKTESSIALPKMYVGQKWLGQNSNIKINSPIVDDVYSLVEGTCTIFQRMNDNGDMLRVSTNVEKLDGTRAIGTYIPAINPDGKPNPVVSKILSGETYYGRAYVVNAWYLTAYKPLFDKNNSVIGILYVGIKQESIDAIRNGIMNIVVGKTGYVFIIGGQGKQKGEFIIHKFPEHVGQNLYEDKDVHGKQYIKEMVDGAVELNDDETFLVDYYWKRNENEPPAKKIASIAYFKDWDWVIGVGTYEDDFMDSVKEINKKFSNMMVSLFVGICLIIIVMGFVVLAISAKIVKPIIDASGSLQDIAEGEGDLTQRLIIKSNDELGVMSKWFNLFVEKIQLMVRDISDNTVTIAAAGTELTAIADEMSKIAGNTVEKANTVSAAAEEMSINMNNVSKSMGQTTDNLNTIAVGTEEMSSSINEIASNASKSTTITKNAVKQAEKASEQVNELGQAAREIVKVTDTISEISNQTNLLALNATIEAARAGDAGKGFAVVANEIKELARQTAEATEQIASQLNGVQKTSEKTAVEIQSITNIINEIDTVVGAIAAAVEQQNATTSENAQRINGITGNINEVTNNVNQSSKAAHQIAQEIASVNESSEEMSNSASMVHVSSDELSKMVEKLKVMVGQFKV